MVAHISHLCLLDLVAGCFLGEGVGGGHAHLVLVF